MKTVIVKLKGLSPYSQSAKIQSEKKAKETHSDFEKRTWKERLHVTNDGFVFIPPMAFKNCLAEAAKFISMSIPGKGKSTYTKHFEAGVLVVSPSILNVKAEDVNGEWLFVPSSGKRGDGKRVDKCFPVVKEWETTVEFIIVDDTITEDVFIKHLDEAGKFIGVGRFRPRNNGFYGRFKVESVKFI